MNQAMQRAMGEPTTQRDSHYRWPRRQRKQTDFFAFGLEDLKFMDELKRVTKTYKFRGKAPHFLKGSK